METVLQWKHETRAVIYDIWDQDIKQTFKLLSSQKKRKKRIVDPTNISDRRKCHMSENKMLKRFLAIKYNKKYS